MKIFKAKQIQEIDKYTIEHEPIESIELMERASQTIAEWIIKKFDPNSNFTFIVGSGNNGGDALAIARIINSIGYPCEIFFLNFSSKISTDCQINLNRIQNETSIKINKINNIKEFTLKDKKTIIIDGIFGTGLSKPVKKLPAEIINYINNCENKVIAIDIPSGLFGEDNSENNGAIVKADYTLSFEFPKLSFFFDLYLSFLGEIFILPIDLHKDIINNKKTNFHYTNQSEIQNIIKPRKKSDHKGIYGHALLIAGSLGKIGANILASKSCMRTGVGLLTTHTPQCGYTSIQSSIPEAMVSIDNNTNYLSNCINTQKYNAVGIGPGLDKKKESVEAFTEILTSENKPMVIDADALNILSENKELLHSIPNQSILTPHPKEFERLTSIEQDPYKRLLILINFAKKYNIFVVLKGHHSCIATPEGSIFFNTTGNQGMATAGSGDVLTGIILSLLAQNYKPEEAAKLGVYLHGLAGDFAAEQKGFISLNASDIIEKIPQAFNSLVNLKK